MQLLTWAAIACSFFGELSYQQCLVSGLRRLA